jgi:integrase
MTEHARRFKRSADADDRNLKLHVLPAWRKRRYDEIERRDVIELVERLVSNGKPTLANRVQALISSIYSFAMDADLVPANPCARLRKRGSETAGERVLSDAEIRLFWDRIVRAPVSRPVGLALRLVLLTGARPGEVAGIRRTEFESLDDASSAAWTIPPERLKNNRPKLAKPIIRPHLVPLSTLATETIVEAMALGGNDQPFLFPSPTVADTSVTPHALAVAMARFAEELAEDSKADSWCLKPPTPHDLRRTVATRLSKLGIRKEDRVAVLNHAQADVHATHYDKYERAAEKRLALETWDRSLRTVLEEASPVVHSATTQIGSDNELAA